MLRSSDAQLRIKTAQKYPRIQEEQRFRSLSAEPEGSENPTDPFLTTDEEEISQKRGADVFYQFEGSVIELSRAFDTFKSAAQQLGSSAGLITGARTISKRLNKVLETFRDNASQQFPAHIKATMIPKVVRLLTPRETLEALHKSLGVFKLHLLEFPLVEEDPMKVKVTELENDLKYYFTAMKTYEGSKSRETRQFYHQISRELYPHFVLVAEALDEFVEVDIPQLEFAERKICENFVNLATIATLLAAATATTLQISIEGERSNASHVVNGFFFSSLTLSITTVIQALLTYTWRHAIYRSPKANVPRLMWTWIQKGPLALMILAIFLFVAGLVGLSYATQTFAVFVVVMVVTVLCLLGLLMVICWFWAEHRIYERFRDADMMQWLRQPRSYTDTKDEVQDLPDGTQATEMAQIQSNGRQPPSKSATILIPTKDGAGSDSAKSDLPPSTSQASLALSHSENNSPTDIRKRPRPQIDGTQVRTKLKHLSITHVFDQHDRLVRHLEFNPDGTLLATCSWDHTIKLWQLTQISKPVKLYRILRIKEFVGQVTWSPNGDLLMTTSSRAIQIWDRNGEKIWETTRPKRIEYAIWLPKSRGFWSAEGNSIVPFTIEIAQMDNYRAYRITPLDPFIIKDRLALFDLAITPNEQTLVVVGRVTSLEDGSRPVLARGERQIIVYSLKEERVVHTIPTLRDIRAVAISNNRVLISGQDTTAPQLWELQGQSIAYLRTYRTRSHHKYAGPAYFGGPNKTEVVYVPTKTGEILIWDVETGGLLQSLSHTGIDGNDLTCAAWNTSGSINFMVASGSHDGTVRIWQESDSPSKLAIGVDDRSSVSTANSRRDSESTASTSSSVSRRGGFGGLSSGPGSPSSTSDEPTPTPNYLQLSKGTAN